MASFGSQKYVRAGEGGAVAVQGFAQLMAALRRIEGETQVELQAKLREIGAAVALVAASKAPRGSTGVLQHSIKESVVLRGASVYSTAVYGGAQNYGAWSPGRGPHIKRANASHYMTRAVDETAPWVAAEFDSILEWVMTTFQEG